MIQAMIGCLKELLEAAGAEEMLGPEVLPGGAAHYLGTCRMGTDPERSVVDPWCRTHDVRNLYVADSSVLVTGGAVNPALTISALATRAAEGIVNAFRRGEL
jgi:choline dehydrogenase-like flavoprotein